MQNMVSVFARWQHKLVSSIEGRQLFEDVVDQMTHSVVQSRGRYGHRGSMYLRQKTLT